MPALLMGRRSGDNIEIRVLRRSSPHANDYWDGNWVACEVEIDVAPWRATYPANFRTDEFSRFRDQLGEMLEGARTEASFRPMEPWLELTVVNDVRGHLTLDGRAGPEGSGKVFGQVRLDFRLDGILDQTDLPDLITDLDAISRVFPTRASPTD